MGFENTEGLYGARVKGSEEVISADFSRGLDHMLNYLEKVHQKEYLEILNGLDERTKLVLF